MKILIIGLLLCISQFSLAQNDGDRIIGTWITQEKNAIFNCYKIGNKYYGKLIWYKPFDPETTKRKKYGSDVNTKFLNKVIMKDFVYEDDEWNSGKIMDLANEKTYSSFVKMTKQNEIKITGFVIFRWLSQSLVLEKMKI
jgi:uncharacterized protein (DUF2147 family)